MYRRWESDSVLLYNRWGRIHSIRYRWLSVLFVLLEILISIIEFSFNINFEIFSNFGYKKNGVDYNLFLHNTFAGGTDRLLCCNKVHSIVFRDELLQLSDHFHCSRNLLSGSSSHAGKFSNFKKKVMEMMDVGLETTRIVQWKVIISI